MAREKQMEAAPLRRIRCMAGGVAVSPSWAGFLSLLGPRDWHPPVPDTESDPGNPGPGGTMLPGQQADRRGGPASLPCLPSLQGSRCSPRVGGESPEGPQVPQEWGKVLTKPPVGRGSEVGGWHPVGKQVLALP